MMTATGSSPVSSFNGSATRRGVPPRTRWTCCALQGIPETLLPPVQRRVQVLRDAYVGAAGHKRPGVAPGLPVPEAEKQAAELSARIRQIMAEGK